MFALLNILYKFSMSSILIYAKTQYCIFTCIYLIEIHLYINYIISNNGICKQRVDNNSKSMSGQNVSAFVKSRAPIVSI